MTLTSGISVRHVNAYHKTNSLLFQFILSEFLDVYTEIQKLQTLMDSKLIASPITRNHKIDSVLALASLEKLVGSSRDYMRFFSTNFSDGLLAKLRTYCAVFIQNADKDEKELMALQHYADKAWQACLQAMDALYGDPSEHVFILSSIDKAVAAMNRFAKLIARIILQFRDDENVIFFILRHKTQFNKLYGDRFILKTFTKMYPKGLREVHLLLSKRYTERGFDNVLDAIRLLIAELEATA